MPHNRPVPHHYQWKFVHYLRNWSLCSLPLASLLLLFATSLSSKLLSSTSGNFHKWDFVVGSLFRLLVEHFMMCILLFFPAVLAVALGNFDLCLNWGFLALCMPIILGSKEAYKYDKNSYTGAIKWKVEIRRERSNARLEWLPARCTFTSLLPASWPAGTAACKRTYEKWSAPR